MRHALCILLLLLAALPAMAGEAPRKKTLAVIPFVPENPADARLADKMRFAVSQKMSRDGNYDRKDNVEVDQMISALQIIMTETPSEEDLEKILRTLNTDFSVTGSVKDRTLTVTLYEGVKKLKSVTADIPPDSDSPKLTVEKLLTDLADVKFAHLRDVECDHSDPAVERLFASRPNLVLDPGFELAAKDAQKVSTNWGAILGGSRYPPPLITAEDAKALGKDRVAVVPKDIAGLEGLPDDPDVHNGHCLMMRMSRGVAEANGLACESIWIPVEHGKKYRFTCWYHSTGPTPRLFIKGFAHKPDQFGSKSDPEAVRREYYRYQVLPRKKNTQWEIIEADFTPSSLKPTDPKVEWIRVDLYIYLGAGDVFFDDIVVKKIQKD